MINAIILFLVTSIFAKLCYSIHRNRVGDMIETYQWFTKIIR
jgi:hypothetical protein